MQGQQQQQSSAKHLTTTNTTSSSTAKTLHLVSFNPIPWSPPGVVLTTTNRKGNMTDPELSSHLAHQRSFLQCTTHQVASLQQLLLPWLLQDSQKALTAALAATITSTSTTVAQATMRDSTKDMSPRSMNSLVGQWAGLLPTGSVPLLQRQLPQFPRGPRAAHQPAQESTRPELGFNPP